MILSQAVFGVEDAPDDALRLSVEVKLGVPLFRVDVHIWQGRQLGHDRRDTRVFVNTEGYPERLVVHQGLDLVLDYGIRNSRCYGAANSF